MAPLVKASEKVMFFTGDSPVKMLVHLAVPGIKAAVADHLIMLFRDVAYEPLYKIQCGDGFYHVLIVLMPVVMERDKVPVILINTGGGDYRSSQIASDIFEYSFRVTGIGLGVDVEAKFMLLIAEGFHFLKRRADFVSHFIQQGSAESVTQVSIVKIFYPPPETVITEAAFGNEAVNVRVPLEIAAKGM